MAHANLATGQRAFSLTIALVSPLQLFDVNMDLEITLRDTYRGRLAPSPTGFLHLGHARTFWTAQQRAVAFGGILVLRNEDLDGARCKSEFVSAVLEDLKWF